ncbi:outer membrane beta-barrel protein [Granulicella sp. S190]|uniref:outer membrane beta-barrel protein n=1 Tax=Granulicella sp. S190 TaxID=1747226 RepID=UPI00131E395E|nr:outer membrane beta-barrel protein [Granulicella sp. S190]
MHTNTGNRLNRILGRTAAVTFLAAAGTLGLHAQQSAGTALSLPPVNLKTSLSAPLNLSIPDDLGYSSSTGSVETANAVDFNLSSDANQPPPRRRYSRPNYGDSHTNPDGSSKYTFVVGGGFTLPVGTTHSVLDTSWKIQGGVGRNFNKTFGVIAQFDYDNFGINTSTLNNLLAIYNGPPIFATDQNGNPLSQIGGSSHDWSFTLNPIFNYYTSDTKGAYVVVGAGFYHKTANITTPAIEEEDTFFGPVEFQANQTIDKYTSNAFGVNGGLGFTYKLSRFASTRFFVEGRYVYTFNSARTFSYGDANGNGFNVFPQNSAKTSYIPITFGLRF